MSTVGGEGHKSKLSVNSSNIDKSNEKITINFAKFKNLKPPKADGITIFSKIEFNDTTVSESQRVVVTSDTTFEFNFVSALNLTAIDQANLDDIAYKPVIITLIEVLPKEKKQKEEKTQILGQATFDLLAFVKGETKQTLKLTLHPVTGSPLESDTILPELTVIVSSDQAFLSDEDQAKSNLIRINLESLYSLPESWTTSTQSYAYTVSLPLPSGDDKDNAVVFVNGSQKMPNETYTKQLRWADTRGIQATNALYIPNGFVTDEPVQDELGDFVSKEDRDFRVNAEKEKPKIVWNTERRCYLNGASNSSLREQVLKTRYWPVEIIRTSIPTTVKGKKDEEFGVSFHGVAYVDMAPLLYPGATRIRGAYKVYPYNESEFLNKTKRKAGLVDDTLRVVNYLFDRNLAASSAKKDSKSGGGEKRDVTKKKKQYAQNSNDQQSNDKIPVLGIIVEPTDILNKTKAKSTITRPLSSLKSNDGLNLIKNSNKRDTAILEVNDEAGGGGGGCIDTTSNLITAEENLRHKFTSNSRSSFQNASEPFKPLRQVKESMEFERHDLNAEGYQYIEAKSFIMIEIKLDKPIIPRRPFENLVKKVSELIPPRPKYPLRNNSAEKAVQDYHLQIKSVINLVLEDYRKLFSNESSLNQANTNLEKYESIDVKRRKLLFELNSSGKYFAFKEQLKNSVIKIVREKYLRTSLFEEKEQMQQFLSELYVFLIDEMHKALNGLISIEDMQPIPNDLSDLQQMKHFAHEAELNRNFDLANYYYQERIARDKNSYSSWLDYASFNLLVEDYPRAEECLKECIAINQNESVGLLLFGVICAMQEKYEIAEIFFDRVTCKDNENVTAWCLYGMFYEQTLQDLNAEITFNKTLALDVSLTELQSQQLQHQLQSHQGQFGQIKEEDEILRLEGDGDGGINNNSNNNDDLTNLAANKLQPQQQQTEGGVSKSRTSKRTVGGPNQASKVANTAKLTPKSPAVQMISNSTAHNNNNNNKSPRSPSNSGQARQPGDDQANLGQIVQQSYADASFSVSSHQSIYMRTAQFLADFNAFVWAEKFLAKELLNPKGGPNCEFHLLLTKIKLSRNQLVEAEKHCTSALAFDYQNCEAWTLWAHIKYLNGDFQDAKERYERVLQFPQISSSDYAHSVYIRLASIYLQEECYEDAKRLFLFACKSSPSCMSWLGVGICCYRLVQLEDAEDALSEANILNNKAPEVWAYLSLICLKTNRPLEAEQAYKYAIKLNLDNQALLDEIHVLQEQNGFGNPEL